MKQVLQNLRTGEIVVKSVPAPQLRAGGVLVRNEASLISSGTERETIVTAQASLLGKARKRPDLVRQVVENVRREGIGATWQKVRSKLDTPKAMGYSSSGVIEAVGVGAEQYRPGDRVACAGGGYAVHAEMVWVPRNLVSLLPDNVAFEDAAFTTLGAIALHGLRRAAPQLGEVYLVIGLGLLGEIAWQILRDSGCTVIGSDISSDAVEVARGLGLDHALVQGKDDVLGTCRDLTQGRGVDGVIITAATSSNNPIVVAGEAARDRGTVVVVGGVPMNIPRSPYYEKELDVRISRSYGPGRYDPSYEEKGLDYPYGYVRWTENRNMRAFLEVVSRGRVCLAPLVTHRFPIEDAPTAYEVVSGRRAEPHLGVLLTYPHSAPATSSTIQRTRAAAISLSGEDPIGVAFVGAGSFARKFLLPCFRDNPAAKLVGIATASGYSARDSADLFGISRTANNLEDLLSDDAVQAVVIATRHDLHVPLALQCLRAGRHVFLEKPLALDAEQLKAMMKVASTSERVLQIGFNRRFSPLAQRLREILAATAMPSQVIYRVNAGPLPENHWLLDPAEGGGRIVGEACHFVDVIQYLCGAAPTGVFASSFGVEGTGSTQVAIRMIDRSQATLIYQANASATLPKEYIEAFSGGAGGVIENWMRLQLHRGGKRVGTVRTKGTQGKGFTQEVEAFLKSIRTGSPAISLESLALTTATTFAILESVRTGHPVDVTGVETGSASG